MFCEYVLKIQRVSYEFRNVPLMETKVACLYFTPEISLHCFPLQHVHNRCSLPFYPTSWNCLLKECCLGVLGQYRVTIVDCTSNNATPPPGPLWREQTTPCMSSQFTLDMASFCQQKNKRIGKPWKHSCVHTERTLWRFPPAKYLTELPVNMVSI